MGLKGVQNIKNDCQLIEQIRVQRCLSKQLGQYVNLKTET